MSPGRHFVGLGTAINVIAVLLGGTIGLLVAGKFPAGTQQAVHLALGIVTIGIGARLIVAAKDFFLIGMMFVFGGLLGSWVGIDHMVQSLGDQAALLIPASSRGSFSEGLVACSILFCIGPMTLLGCLEDALAARIDLLKMKSMLDGVASIFFAASFGFGVLASALVVLIVQGGLTLLARQLQSFAKDEDLVNEVGQSGGPILVCVGLSLAGLTQVSSAIFLPSIVLVLGYRLFERRLKVKNQD
jgi:uncharacterized membrane protein YqgA involved in biofilm formation